jgi:lipopolysaccharide transport system permease protein
MSVNQTPEIKTQHQELESWDLIIQPQGSLFDLKLKDVYRYRFLLWLFVKRDFVAQYKQTILGPLWHFISPIFTTLTYMLIFGNIAKLSTDGTPQAVFYMSGITIWNFFAQTLTATGSTFISNSGIFGKVYFPRLIAPLSTVVSRMVQFGIQIVLLLGFVIYFKSTGSLEKMRWANLIWFPGILLLMAGFGLGLGIIISSLTTKYRDLNVLVGFGVNLVMYATPVIYPMSSIPNKYLYFLQWNPLAPLVECFRFIFTGSGSFNTVGIAFSTLVMCVFLMIGLLLFNKVEKTFMDTV